MYLFVKKASNPQTIYLILDDIKTQQNINDYPGEKEKKKKKEVISLVFYY